MNSVHELTDLNLIVLLDALLTEGSATRAARRLGITQSAASHGLRRLRGALGDPLLVRAGRGLVPTPRAEALRQPVHEALAALDAALAPAAFDPASARARFVLQAPDYAGILLLPDLAAALASEAPGVALQIRGPLGDVAESLASDVDLAIGTAPDEADALYRARLWDDGFSCAVRADHPAIHAPWDLDLYCRLGHVLIAPRGLPGGPVDVALEALGRRRSVVVQVPHFVVAAHVVAGSDLVVTFPTRVAARLAPMLGLAIRPPPLALPGFTLVAQWHARRHADPAHRWLRARLATLARRVTPRAAG